MVHLGEWMSVGRDPVAGNPPLINVTHRTNKNVVHDLCLVSQFPPCGGVVRDLVP